jgi:hypothetical protein
VWLLAPSISNPDPLDFTHAHIIVALVIKFGGFSVRVPGHALRHFDASSVRQVVGDPGGAERVTANGRLETRKLGRGTVQIPVGNKQGLTGLYR